MTHVPAAALDQAELNRLKWHCRRGLLENDIVLEKFMESRLLGLDAAQLAGFRRLLDLPDTDLWDLVSGRLDCSDPAMAEVLEMLRSC